VKKLLLLTYCFIAINFGLWAQNFAITYDTKLAEDDFDYTGVLWVGNIESLFVWKDHPEKVWEKSRQEGDDITSQDVFTDIVGYQIQRVQASTLLKCRDFCRKEYPLYYEDDITFDWKITADKEMISDYNVTKAEVEFRGRTYEAWFSEEIPINAGPWKFFGLPGLILEVGSTDGAVSIRLSEIKKMNDTEFPSFLKEATTMTRLAYNECLDKTYELDYKKSRAIIAELQAKYPDIELSNGNRPNKRTKTELID
jgi:GLPGLI family protein